MSQWGNKIKGGGQWKKASLVSGQWMESHYKRFPKKSFFNILVRKVCGAIEAFGRQLRFKFKYHVQQI